MSTEIEYAPGRFIRLPEVRRRVPLSRSGIYEGIKQGWFPAPVNIGPRAVAWVETEIDNWIATRIQASRGNTVPVLEER